jgi:ABC transporter substrate binding protein
LVLSAFLWAPWTSAEAQEPPKLPRVGVLTALAHAAISTRIEGFRQGLRELGYVEGKNILLEYRSAEGQLDRLPALAAELDRLRVDVIVTGGPQATRPARNATATIPIVMAQDSNPVEAGFVASLARPGGNITGLSNLYPELSGKQLELLKEIVPGLSRVAVLGQSSEPGNAQAWSAAERGAGLLGLKLQYVDVRGAGDIEPCPFRLTRPGVQRTGCGRSSGAPALAPKGHPAWTRQAEEERGEPLTGRPEPSAWPVPPADRTVLRRLAHVTMMEAADHGGLDDPAVVKVLHWSWLRGVLRQGEVGAGPVVVDEVPAQ